jgi:hypothetical protein
MLLRVIERSLSLSTMTIGRPSNIVARLPNSSCLFVLNSIFFILISPLHQDSRCCANAASEVGCRVHVYKSITVTEVVIAWAANKLIFVSAQTARSFVSSCQPTNPARSFVSSCQPTNPARSFVSSSNQPTPRIRLCLRPTNQPRAFVCVFVQPTNPSRELPLTLELLQRFLSAESTTVVP